MSRRSERDEFSLKNYELPFSLDNLVPGVDNIRHDVHVSPLFEKTTAALALRLIGKYARAEEILPKGKHSSWVKEKDEFGRLCREVLLAAVNRAKQDHEIHIDYLAQTAIVKLIIETLKVQYDIFIQHFKEAIKKREIGLRKDERSHDLPGFETAYRTSLRALTLLKQRLSATRQERKAILRYAGRELFSFMFDVQHKGLREIREANFGKGLVLHDHFFCNPILYVEDPSEDLFMIEEYALMGRRFEDPDRYDAVLSLVRSVFRELELEDDEPEDYIEDETLGRRKPVQKEEEPSEEVYVGRLDSVIKHVSNIDTLFDYFQTRHRYDMTKARKGGRAERVRLKSQARDQKKLLSIFFKEFEKVGLIQRIVASYEMQTILSDYCPPLPVQQLMQYLLDPVSRKAAANKFKRYRGPDGKALSMEPLRKKAGALKRIKAEKKRRYLVEFLRAFARYHRDLLNAALLGDAMDHVNLTCDERTLRLSHANRTLYEFLLPQEMVLKAKPIINHVILKADIRGSTELTHRMKERGLNPASYFSLNFFDPVSEILADYGASKVFVEGDALIIAIYEQKDTPEQWYSVARTCGLAITILNIVRQYNLKNVNYGLPSLELGLGICHSPSSPTFLFDGDKPIMISQAINLADRLAGCDKTLRKRIDGKKRPFSLYVFQALSDTEIDSSEDDLFQRYNVGGIELNGAGFQKLSEEIDLKTIQTAIPELGKEVHTLHTGKFPTVTGNYQRLILREAHIYRTGADGFKAVTFTQRKYYEVCTNPKVFEFVRKTL